MNLVVKLMPNLVGVMARPRLRHRCAALKASAALRRSSNSLLLLTSDQQAPIRQCSSTCIGEATRFVVPTALHNCGTFATMLTRSSHAQASTAGAAAPKPGHVVHDRFKVASTRLTCIASIFCVQMCKNAVDLNA